MLYTNNSLHHVPAVEVVSAAGVAVVSALELLAQQELILGGELPVREGQLLGLLQEDVELLALLDGLLQNEGRMCLQPSAGSG